ncbi:MAG TPA: DUF4203 domain-containing protein, partial [Aggregatilineales bacterium]|nr:DUF4203 domain-containing protein [Aggregatilineales bacterium]
MGLQLSGSNLAAYAVVLGVLGLVECFFGYKFFRILLAVAGFFIGAQLGASFALAHTSQSVVIVLIELITGVIGAVLFYYLYFVGFFLAGMGLGASVATVLAANLGLTQEVATVVVVIGAIIGGLLGFILSKYIIMISTAFIGATQIIAAAIMLFMPSVGAVQSWSDLQARLGHTGLLIATAGIAVLTIFGFFFQFRTNEPVAIVE